MDEKRIRELREIASLITPLSECLDTIERLRKRLAFWEKHGTILRNGALSLLDLLGKDCGAGDQTLETAASLAHQEIEKQQEELNLWRNLGCCHHGVRIADGSCLDCVKEAVEAAEKDGVLMRSLLSVFGGKNELLAVLRGEESDGQATD